MNDTILFKKRIYCCILLIIFFSFSSCMQSKYSFVSPGRIIPDSLKSHNDFFNIVSDSISGNTKGTYEVIGHGAGAWRYYPMGINKKGIVYGNGFRNKKTQAHGIIQLIDKSISFDPTMSIELDAQYAPEKDPIRKIFPEDGAYILHDIPKWGAPEMIKETALEYLHNNTVQKAIDHFVNKGYYKNCKMYVEIKVAKNCYDPCPTEECVNQCRDLANELVKYARDYPTSNNENWLCVTSFSPLALERFRSFLPDDVKDNFDYVLILGYTGGWPTSKLAQLKGYVPEFNDSISSFVIRTEWIDCIWFSVQGIKNYKPLFTKMVKQRQHCHPEYKDLEFSFATYPFEKKKMKELLTNHPEEKIKIRSYMLDLDYAVE